MAPHRMRKDTPHRMAEELLCRYMDHIERDIQIGKALPMTSLERISLEIAFEWISERYDITPKWIANKQRAAEKKEAKVRSIMETGN